MDMWLCFGVERISTDGGATEVMRWWDGAEYPEDPPRFHVLGGGEFVQVELGTEKPFWLPADVASEPLRYFGVRQESLWEMVRDAEQTDGCSSVLWQFLRSELERSRSWLIAWVAEGHAGRVLVGVPPTIVIEELRASMARPWHGLIAYSVASKAARQHPYRPVGS